MKAIDSVICFTLQKVKVNYKPGGVSDDSEPHSKPTVTASDVVGGCLCCCGRVDMNHDRTV